MTGRSRGARSRAAVRWLTSGALALLLFAVVAAVNYISARHLYQRVDLTAAQQFTIAPSTRRILASLEDLVNLKVYFSRELPEQVATIPAEVRDLLDELSRHSGGKLRIDHVDPDADPEIESRVRSLGIPKLPIGVLERNRTQSIDIYLGMALFYGDRKEIIPYVVDTRDPLELTVDSGLEYEIMSAILRLTREPKTVGFLVGHGEHDPVGDYQIVADVVRRSQNVETVDLAATLVVPDHIQTLVVAGPRQPIDPWHLYQIDQFLMRGGRALLLTDMIEVDPQQLLTRQLDHGLDELLATYGVRPLASLVADWAEGAQEVVQVPDEDSQLAGSALMRYVPYPLWPRVVYLSVDHPTVSHLPGLMLPWISPLELTRQGPGRAGVTALARSTEYAWAEHDLVSAHPRAVVEPPADQLRQYVLAAAITGPLLSHWADREPPPRPAATGGDDDGQLEARAIAPQVGSDKRAATDDTAIVIVGSSEFVSDSLVQQGAFESNLVFLQNAIDWLTSGDELIGIRSRFGRPPILDPTRRRTGERWAPFVNLAVVPGLVVLFGLSRRAARRRRAHRPGASGTGASRPGASS